MVNASGPLATLGVGVSEVAVLVAGLVILVPSALIVRRATGGGANGAARGLADGGLGVPHAREVGVAVVLAVPSLGANLKASGCG